MGSEQLNPEAMLADLCRRRAELNTAIKTICGIYGLPIPADSDSPVPPGPGGGNGARIAPDAYLGMSIPDATKAHLTATRKKLSTQEVLEALEAGGLPKSSYQTVYGVLRRREMQVGDVVNYKGDWGLAEWFPGYRKPQAKRKKGDEAATGTAADGEVEAAEGEEPEEEATA